MRDKKGFEFSFGWIFAIIVGAIILFLALYASSKIIKQGELYSDSKTAKQLGIIATGFETSLEDGRTDSMTFPSLTKIYNGCDTKGNFGSQKISTSSFSGLGNKFSEPGVNSSFASKYIFSSDVLDGREFIVLSKSFSMPFKIADLFFIWPANQSYCFLDAPEKIDQELSSLKTNNLMLNSSIQLVSFGNRAECKKGSVRVCFNTISGCDVNVLENRVKKAEKSVYYNSYEDDSLLYAAIFSSPELYECQLKRLIQRASSLSLLYKEKSEMLSPRGCSSNLEGQLTEYYELSKNYKDSKNLEPIFISSKELGGKNEELSCPLF